MKILLATDGSDNANAALDFLQRFPLPAQCSITLLNVIDERLFVDPDAVELNVEQRDALHHAGETFREEAYQFLGNQAERLARDGCTVETMVRSGYVAEEILMAAEDLQVDLAVIGAHGLSVSRYFLLGSVATKVLEYAPCSVLVVKQTAEETSPRGAIIEVPEPVGEAGDWRILLAYDDSRPARKAVSLCASLPFGKQDEIIVVTVLTLVTAFRQDIRQYMNPISQQKKIATKAALDSVVATLRGSLPNVSSRLVEGANSAHEIIEHARHTGCDLIILGNKGKKAIHRFLLGSITSHVARHAPCSVWVVRD